MILRCQLQTWTATNVTMDSARHFLGKVSIAFSSCAIALRGSMSAFPFNGNSHCHGLAAYSAAFYAVNSIRP